MWILLRDCAQRMGVDVEWYWLAWASLLWRAAVRVGKKISLPFSKVPVLTAMHEFENKRDMYGE